MVDKEFYENNYRRLIEYYLNEILDSLSVIPEPEKSQIQEFINVSEYGIAFEAICGFLIEEDYPVTEKLHKKILLLAGVMEIRDIFWKNIKVKK